MQMKVQKNIPGFLIGDPTRLKQVLASLLDNAIKFTPSHGKVSLSIKPVSFKNGEHEISFSICDNGVGIRDKDKEDIWKTFSMGDMSLTRENHGTGLGLTLSHQLCHLLGGEMYFESEHGKGSVFTFTIKMEEGKPPQQNNNRQQKILDILLVEDNLINQKLTQKILINQGFHVDVADNGKMAVKKFSAHHYDLIFMDIQMPLMDGLEATKKIRKIEATSRMGEERVKIIALTANSQQQDKENCLAAGMDDYINKPFNVKKFPLILSNMDAH
jgi:CheY-like chemotaxis protein/anti-sigma regulatory factor (Ser/Thr protein kinase)